MANARDAVMKSASRADAALLRREKAIVKAVMEAYDTARAELEASFMARFADLGELTPAQIRQLANDSTLINAIDVQMGALAREFEAIIQNGIRETSRAGFLQAQAEVMIYAEALGVDLFTFSVDEMLAILVEVAVDQVPDVVDATRRLLKNELRISLISGESMSDISKRLFQKTPFDGKASVFQRGKTSADLFTRRAVIQANNNSKQIAIEKAKEQIPELQRQAVAHVASGITQTCLRVHGQIVDVDEPFELSGEPRFGRKLMHPPFHWNCRTTVVAYHPAFESTSNLTTADMRQQARQYLNA